MRIPDTRTAIQHVKWRYHADGSADPELGDDPGPVHAVLRGELDRGYGRSQWDRVSQRTEIDYESGSYVAACDKTVRVILPFEFDDADEDACQLCITRARQHFESPAEWSQDRRERREYWRRRDEQLRDDYERQRQASLGVGGDLEAFRDTAYDEDDLPE